MRLRRRSSRPCMLGPFASPLFAGAIALLLVAGCKEAPPTATVDAAPAPIPTDAAPTVLVPLDEDAAVAVDASPAPVHHAAPGSGLTSNQARAKQCCNALRAQAKSLGASPEANMLVTFAAQCDMVATQMGPTSGGQAPEFAALRQLLKGHTIPGVCNGL